MGMYCEKRTMIGCKKYMKYQVAGSRQRGRPEDLERDCAKKCQAYKLNREDATHHCRWRKLIKDGQ